MSFARMPAVLWTLSQRAADISVPAITVPLGWMEKSAIREAPARERWILCRSKFETARKSGSGFRISKREKRRRSQSHESRAPFDASDHRRRLQSSARSEFLVWHSAAASGHGSFPDGVSAALGPERLLGD